jgi:hypothetical protein
MDSSAVIRIVLATTMQFRWHSGRQLATVGTLISKEGSMSSKQRRAARQPQEAPSGRPVWLWGALIGAIVLVTAGGLGWLFQGRQASTASTPQVTGGPSAAIDQAMFDYGDVKLGTTIKAQFRVKNVGDQQLAFTGAPRVEVREGC